jgi:GTP pyrophosphokinase
MVSRLSDQEAPAGVQTPLTRDLLQAFLAPTGLSVDPDRHWVEVCQHWFQERFSVQLTSRAEHAWRVAFMLAEIGAHPACVAVALLRSVPWENLRPLAIVKTLPEDVAAMLSDLDKGDKVLARISGFESLGEDASAKNNDEAVRKLMLTLAQDVRAVVVLLAERLDHLRQANQASSAEIKEPLARQTLVLHAPLANRIGVWQIKWELEDLSFRFLEPQTYKEIAGLLDERRSDRERWIEAVIAELRGELAGLGIQAEVQGRPKHIYSIWKKMKLKGLSFSQLMDVRAVRVVVDTIDDCYVVLGVVHDKWAPIPGEFDDYIAQPKGNFYRSLHTAVLGPEQKPLEVQIRTQEMHQESELGVAAHWRYKEGTKSDRRFDERVVWLRQMLDWSREVTGGEVSGPKDDTIYVFTPQGRVIDLPAGSTPVDFAYHVHTDLGHRCRGARVDGAMVPLHHRLESGQRVEITVAKQGGPSRDWLNPELGFLHSHRALSKVRHWFNQQNLSESLALGRHLLDKAIQRAGKGQPNLERVAHELGFSSTDDLLLALSRNEVSSRQLELALDPAGLVAPALPDEDVLKTSKPQATSRHDPVQVLGVSNIATTLAKCCHPVPPEPVVGFVTRGHGVTIHREDCPSLSALGPGQKERLIPAAWGESQTDRYAVDIAVEAQDRQGLLRDISDALTREKINVNAVNTLTRGHLAHMQFTISITHRDQLTQALKSVGAVNGVEAAFRR